LTVASISLQVTVFSKWVWPESCAFLGECFKTVRPMLSDCCLSCLFVTLVYCGQTVGWIKVKLGMQVDLGPGHVVLDGDPAPSAPKGHSPQFSAHVYCGQTAGWIKMPLGTEVDLSPGHIVLDGDPAHPLCPHERETAASLFLADVYFGHGRHLSYC